jgi:membrane-associated phospholipid phosphatase
MSAHYVTALALLLHSSSLLFAQDTTVVEQEPVVRPSLLRTVAQDGKHTGQTILRTYAQPLHWQKKDFLRLGGALAISASALLVDEQLSSYLQRNHTNGLDKLERVGYFLGKPTTNYPVMIALWASGVAVKNEWLRDTGLMVIASVTTSGLVQTAAKELAGRARPGARRGNLYFDPLSNNADYHSFPSGHTMLSVATSWILARQVKSVPLKVVFFALPVITGGSRVYVGAHWLSDVLLGSALGIACAESVLRLYPAIKANRAYSINVIPTGNGATLLVRL